MWSVYRVGTTGSYANKKEIELAQQEQHQFLKQNNHVMDTMESIGESSLSIVRKIKNTKKCFKKNNRHQERER